MKRKIILCFGIMITMVLFVACGSSKEHTITKDGTYEYSDKYETIVIESANVILENTTAKNILIGDKVGDGDVALDNITVTENLEVYGGGENSVHIKNSKVKNLVAGREDKNNRVVIEEGSKVTSLKTINFAIIEIYESVDTIELGGSPTVAIKENATIGDLTVNSDAKNAHITVEGGLTDLAIKSGAIDTVVVISGTTDNLVIEEGAMALSIDVNGEVGRVDVKDNAVISSLEIAGKVLNVAIASLATTESIQLTGVITTLHIEAAVAISGSGTIMAVQSENENAKSNIASTIYIAEDIPVMPTYLRMPTLSIAGNILSWDRIDHASSYAIYVNGKKVSTVATTSLDISSYLVVGTNNIQIKALTVENGYQDSDYSNKVTKTVVAEKTYSITFNTNGGTAIPTQTIKETVNTVKPSNPTKAGYTFAGWYTSDAYTTEYSFGNKLSANVTVYAKWLEAWNGTSVSYTWYGDGTASKFVISNASELAGFRNIVNGVAPSISQDSFVGKTIELSENIDLNAKNWTYIGTGSYEFKGTFDGQNKTIMNLSIKNSIKDYGGLFRSVTNANLKNIGFAKVDIEVTGWVGTLTGLARNSTISNITIIDGEIKASGDLTSVSGIVEYLQSSTMTDVTNGANVTITNAQPFVLAAGISSEVNGSIIERATNNGNVSITFGSHASETDISYAAGIAAYMKHTSTIKESVNNGTITFISERVSMAGGIVGYMWYDIASVETIDGCTNNGNIIVSGADSFVGGIVAQAYTWPITNLFVVKNNLNTGNLELTLKASVKGITSAMGGIIGWCGKPESLTATGNVNSGTITHTGPALDTNGNSLYGNFIK